MQWVLLGVIIVALLYLARYSPKIAYSILGALVIGAIAIVISTSELGKNNRSKILADDIEIENPVMVQSYGGSYRFNARLINNNADMSAKELAISITMLDCEDEASCSVIGQREERVILQIPPGQARDLSRTVSFDNASSTKNLKWEHKVTEAKN